jgi:hypothetical protein
VWYGQAVSAQAVPRSLHVHVLLLSLRAGPSSLLSAADRTTSGTELSRKEIPMTDMTVVQEKMKAIATAHTDYAKSFFEANRAYLEKLATIKAADEAIQITTDHMKSAYEAFVAEAIKINDMYKDFFKTAYDPTMAGMPKLKAVN